MRPILGIVLTLGCCVAHSQPTRFGVALKHHGISYHATFLTSEDPQFSAVANAVDRMRQRYYLGEANKEGSTVQRDYQAGFFDWEPLRQHSEILVLHRRLQADEDPPHPHGLIGIHPVVVAAIAVQRLTHPNERLLMESRLKPLGISVPRPEPLPWMNSDSPLGIYPHWQPQLKPYFETPNALLYGDVIQANSLFAREGTWPLLHSIANRFGLFSVGQILGPEETVWSGDVQLSGPRLHIPSLVVWETFNEYRDNRSVPGSRTRYYLQSGASALTAGDPARDEWLDPRFNIPIFVQILAKSGEAFRGGWTEHFARREQFVFVRDVEISRTEYQSVRLGTMFSVPVPMLPEKLSACVEQLLASNRHPIQQWDFPLTVGVSIGAGPEVSRTFRLRGSSQ